MHMDSDAAFHHPPELTTLLIDTIPLLVKAKKDVVLFFRGAGVPSSVMNDIQQRVETDRASINKYEIVRTILTRLNEKTDTHLRERREVVKRVLEWENFSTCYPENILKAKGLISDIGKIVNVKDSFTRMNQEREAVTAKHRASEDAKVKAIQQRNIDLEAVKGQFYALFGQKDPNKRGKMLEVVLNQLFRVADILVTESFTVVGNDGEGIIEQVDGGVEVDGEPYLVEMKWLSVPVGREPMCSHIVRVYNRGGLVRGIFISYSDFTDPAITVCKDALARGGAIILCTIQELVEVLEDKNDLKKFFKDKINAGIILKTPFARYQRTR